ncbi:MAG: KH domain-containing protein [bacterium]|nr:KH domain-containing protein [bacterium]
MRSVEVSAKTRETAIKEALDQLRAERYEVEVEILDEGSSGIFGIGARPVKLRVTLDSDDEDEPSRPPADTRRQPRERSRSRSGSRSRSDRGPRDRKPESRSKREPRPRQESRPKPDGRPEPKPKPKPEPKARPEPKREPVAKKPTPDREAEPPKDRKPVDEARAREAAALLQEMIGKMGIEATVENKNTPEGDVLLGVDSPDSAILIGRKGRNLNALQYLINRMAHRTTDGPEDAERLIVDIEGYHDRRRASLEEMAQRMAEKVKESGRRIRIKPLNPQERRVIHVTLQDDPDVRTFSVGNTLVRSVVIAPKNEEGDGEDRPPRRRRRPRRGGRSRGGQSSAGDHPSTASADIGGEGDSQES